MTPEPVPDDKRHIDYFDPIRLMAAGSVVFMHAASAPLWQRELDAQWVLLTVCTSFAFTAVPLFLMMAGYLALSRPRNAGVFCLFTKRLPRLVAPLAFWTVAAAVYLLAAQHSLTAAALFDSLVLSLQNPVMVHLWYMYLLIALALLSPFLAVCVQSLDKTGHRYALGLIAALTIQSMLYTLLPTAWGGLVNLNVFTTLKIFSGNLWVYLLGYYLGSVRRKIPNRLLAIAAALLLGTIIVGTCARSIRAGVYTADFQNESEGFEPALAACIFLLWKQNFKGKLPGVLRPAVALILPVYMMHNILLSVLGNYLVVPVTFWGTVKLTVLVYLVCFLCTKTLASIKPLCYLTTGMPYRTACETCNWQYTLRSIRRRARRNEQR